jgi:F-box and WD-40 domain protein CDC4
MSRWTNQPEVFPLRKVAPQYDFKLCEPNSRLAGTCLVKDPEPDHPKPADASRKRMWTLGEAELSLGESCDDLGSDHETNSIVLNTGSMMALMRENRLVHPPKRRLMTSDAFSEILVGPHAVAAAAPPLAAAAAAAANAAGPAAAAAPGGAPRTPSFNSASNTPVSEMEDDPHEPTQALPLPLPSALPSLSTEDLNPAEQYPLMPFAAPATQAELLQMMMDLAGLLNEKNHNHLIYKLLQNVRRLALSSFGDVIKRSLKRDLISNLPLEITYSILRQLDYRTLCLLSRVCRSWHKILNNTAVWAHLLKRDKLVADDAEIEREIGCPDLMRWLLAPSLVNPTQLLFKKRRIILNRWMDPAYEPRRISVPGHGSNLVTCLQHDDDKIITGVDVKLINIYSTKTGQLLKVLKGHDGGVWALKYTGNTLVSGLTDRTVRVWNIKTGKCVQVFRGHTLTVRCLDILHPVKIGTDDNGEDIVYPASPLLVTGLRDHNLHVWKLPLVGDDDDDDGGEVVEVDAGVEEANPHLVAVLTGHTHAVRLVCGYGNVIVLGLYDTTVRVWDLMDGGKCRHVLAGHQDKIYLTALDFAHKRCYLGSMDRTIKVWDIERGKLLHTLEGHELLVGLLELLLQYLVSAAADATLRVWDPATGKTLSKLEGHLAAITCFQHDRLRIVSGSEKMLKLWDIQLGRFVRDLLADITGGIWQVRFDYSRCVAAVQRTRNDSDEAFIEIVDFSAPPERP